MQDLLSKILWSNDEIPEQAARLCETLPGYDTAKREFDETAQKVQDIIGYSLFDQLQNQFLRRTSYEVRAYYALGLGLREALIRELGM